MTPIDMNKVEAAVAALEARRKAREAKAHAAAKTIVTKDHRTYPPVASLPAQDSSIRKPLRAHGFKCSGFNHHAFLNDG
jgi:N-acetylglutamate synthase/N-acetylornithine aminotransferase